MRRLAAAGLGALLACATVRPPPEPVRVTLPAETVEVRRADLDLAAKNDEELFAVGQAAFQSGDLRRAAAAFGRIADLFPTSRRHAAAAFNAGLALQRAEDWGPARDRFAAFVREYAGPDADDAALRLADCHHQLGEDADARSVLERLLGRPDFPRGERIRALTRRGVLELEGGDADRAESSLQQALGLWAQGRDEERIDDEPPARAHFWLGEVYRARFQATPLDFTASEEAQGEALEAKSRLLLAAQAHYFQAARRGNADFGVAGVARVGELYEQLHARMLEAPVPPGLDEEERAAWRAELRRQVRNLVSKAVEAYEVALAAARARGVENRFVERAQEAVERMKRMEE